jgi:hypothetical protein
MSQPLRSRSRSLGYFLRGATHFAQPRTINAIARFVTGILTAAYDKSVAAIQQVVADAPTASAMRQFLCSAEVTPKLEALLDWKTGHAIRKALRSKRNRRGPILFTIDSTYKSSLGKWLRNAFKIGRWAKGQARNHIYVCGMLQFPDGRCLPVRLRQKKRGRGAATQIDLACELVRQLTVWLRQYEVIVLADGFFFSRKLVNVLRASPFHYVLACQSNTVLKDGRSLKTLFKRVRLHRSCATLPGSWGKRLKIFSAARRDVDLKCRGRQVAVHSRLYRKQRAQAKYLISDLSDLPLEQLVGLYSMRWQVEVYFRDVKMFLGFDQYRVTGLHGPENFVLLVTLAYQFLHWRAEASADSRGTLVRLRRLQRILEADNIRVIERAVLTRHARKGLQEHFAVPPASGALSSRRPQNARSGPKTAS